MKINLSLNKILFSIIIFLALIFALSTIVVFATKRAEPGKNLRNADPTPQSVVKNAPKTSKLASYTGIERIRAVTESEEKFPNGVSVVITPWFSYTEGDTEFFEELSRKSSQIKSIIVLYFSRHTYSDLKKTGEKRIKAELLKEINEKLVLNKIKEIYFSEYIFLE